jgi:hypothetical protein
MHETYQQCLAQVEATVAAILRQKPARRASLLLHLFEAYDAGERSEDAEATLRAVRDDLTLRLEDGGW